MENQPAPLVNRIAFFRKYKLGAFQLSRPGGDRNPSMRSLFGQDEQDLKDGQDGDMNGVSSILFIPYILSKCTVAAHG